MALKEGDINGDKKIITKSESPKGEHRTARQEKRGKGKSRRIEREDMDNPRDSGRRNFRSRFPFSTGSGYHLDALRPIIDDIVKHHDNEIMVDNKKIGFDFILIPPRDCNITIESVVAYIWYDREEDGKTIKTAMVYTGLLPVKELGEQSYRAHNRSVTVSAVASDAYTERYMDAVADKITLATGIGYDNILHIGAMTVPYGFDYKNENKVACVVEQMLKTLWYRYMTYMTDFDSEPLVELFTQDNREYELRSTVESRPMTHHNLFGIQEASDITITLKCNELRTRRRRNHNVLDVDGDMPNGFLRANVDLVYKGNKKVRGGRGLLTRKKKDEGEPVPLYGVALNIMDISSDNDSLGWQLAILANIAILADEKVLYDALRPRDGQFVYRNPSALLCEQPFVDASCYPEIYNPDDPNYHSTRIDQDDWIGLMEDICYEECLFIQLHIPVTGANCQLMDLLLQTCSKDKDEQESAIDKLNDVLDAVTDGNWDGHNLEVAYLTDQQAQIGYYNEGTEVCSLSSINRFNLMTAWGDTYDYLKMWDVSTNSEKHRHISNAKQQEVLNAYTNGSATYLDRAHVIRFNPEWLLALEDAFAASGVAVDVKNITRFDSGRRAVTSRYKSGNMSSRMASSRDDYYDDDDYDYDD